MMPIMTHLLLFFMLNTVQVHAFRFIYDKVTNASIEHTWLEVGFAYLDDTDWLTITTKNADFKNDVLAFISLPNIGGSLHNESIPLVPQVQELPVKNFDNTWTFKAKLVQAKGSYCSTQWYTPVPVEPLLISWMAVEKRVFEMAILDDNLNFKYYQTLLVDSSDISRNNSNSDLSNGETDGNGNFKRVW